MSQVLRPIATNRLGGSRSQGQRRVLAPSTCGTGAGDLAPLPVGADRQGLTRGDGAPAAGCGPSLHTPLRDDGATPSPLP